METFSCQSGSNGNCIFVQAGRTRILLDAGISGKIAEGRMALRGQAIRDVDALVLSHDHSDHSRSAGIFQRKYGLPILASAGTVRACGGEMGSVHDVRPFEAGATLEIGELLVHTLPTPHDGADGVCFVLEHRGLRLGVLTDLGFVFPELEELLPTLDAVYLESNYDPDMLRTGPYPPHLKRRIVGDGGHISNQQAAELLRDFTDGRLRWAALSHLSQTNNDPRLAHATARAILGERLALHVASRYDVSPVFTL